MRKARSAVLRPAAGAAGRVVGRRRADRRRRRCHRRGFQSSPGASRSISAAARAGLRLRPEPIARSPSHAAGVTYPRLIRAISRRARLHGISAGVRPPVGQGLSPLWRPLRALAGPRSQGMQRVWPSNGTPLGHRDGRFATAAPDMVRGDRRSAGRSGDPAPTTPAGDRRPAARHSQETAQTNHRAIESPDVDRLLVGLQRLRREFSPDVSDAPECDLTKRTGGSDVRRHRSQQLR